MIETWEKEMRDSELHDGKAFEDQERVTGIHRLMPNKGELREWLYTREEIPSRRTSEGQRFLEDYV